MKLKFQENMSGAQMIFHAQNENSMKPANNPALNTKILQTLCVIHFASHVVLRCLGFMFLSLDIMCYDTGLEPRHPD
jgi:hypothetical protein